MTTIKEIENEIAELIDTKNRFENAGYTLERENLAMAIRHHDSEMTSYLMFRSSLEDKKTKLYEVVEEAASLHRDIRVIMENQLKEAISN